VFLFKWTKVTKYTFMFAVYQKQYDEMSVRITILR